MKKTKTAFSLIELSIVLIIVAVIAAGITQSSRLVNQFKLAGARWQSKNSAVVKINDLAAWFDATAEESFASLEAQDLAAISSWQDINPASNNKHHLAIKDSARIKPFYVANCINNLPCVRFSNATTYLTFGYDGANFLANSDYTIFIVAQRQSSNEGYILGSGAAPSSNANDRLLFGYIYDNSIIYSQNLNDYIATVENFSQPAAKIHSIVFGRNLNSIRNYFLNSNAKTLEPHSSYDLPAQIQSYYHAAIAYDSASEKIFDGDIAEIIIFTRALDDKERQNVEDYLRRKWKI